MRRSPVVRDHVRPLPAELPPAWRSGASAAQHEVQAGVHLAHEPGAESAQTLDTGTGTGPDEPYLAETDGLCNALAIAFGDAPAACRARTSRSRSGAVTWPIAP